MRLRASAALVSALLVSMGAVLAHPSRVSERLGAVTTVKDSHPAGEPGMRNPAAITTLVPVSQDDAAAVTAWLGTYDAAFNARDLEKLATFYHPDVTIYEGAGINNGWADYRDRHLGPELKAFQNLQFAHSETKVTVLPGGQSAYATSRYTLKTKIGDRDIDSEGLATYVLIKSASGTWQIRHSHTSSRARHPAA
jgi:ketosteroid isomerase-like protein